MVPALSLGLLVWAAPQLRAQLSDLGSAADFAGLELDPSASFIISKSTTQIAGNAGVVAGGNLNFSGGGTISGQIDAGSGASLSISGGSTATGGTITSDAAMTQVVSDAENAASYYAGLTPSDTLSSLGGGTISGNGGLNVYQVNGDLSMSNQTLTISGGAADTFVFNLTGNVDLSRSNIVLSGISSNQVLFNLIGSGATMTTSGDSGTSGIFLAENGAMDIQGGVHDSEFIAGGNLTFESGVNITQPAAALAAVPELDPPLMAAAALVLLAGLAVLARPGVHLHLR